jgi:hypothetical protein
MSYNYPFFNGSYSLVVLPIDFTPAHELSAVYYSISNLHSCSGTMHDTYRT